MNLSWCYGARRWLLLLALTLSIASCSDAKKARRQESVARQKESSLQEASARVAVLRSKAAKEKDPKRASSMLSEAAHLENKIRQKFQLSGLSGQNIAMLDKAMNGHTKLYKFEGNYRILVIPVEFPDKTFEQESFFAPGSNGSAAPAQEYLFGSAPSSLTTYYRHTSMGRLDVGGSVVKPVKVDHDLAFYGEAVTGSNDKNARRLVVDALEKVKAEHQDADWWDDFDNWDLSDYDADKNFHEPDGFLDAVVLIYAGKAQASCQRSFDPQGLKPASSEVPAGPRHDATVECFNRLWPHRWSIALTSDDPLYSSSGPVIEGVERPSLNGLKISERVFAFDYNMQSEFSDLSTFMHEFGHSLSLPDVYAYSGTNNTGGWDIMSSNLNLVGQEMSSFSKLSLGWVAPKVVKQGEATSAYLGSWNFVPHNQRDGLASFEGPIRYDDFVDGDLYSYDVLSLTPEYQEPVYRSLAVVTDPTSEFVRVADFNEANGRQVLYSGRYDNESRAFKLSVDVPAEGDATLSFDTIYAIETETNFDGVDPDIKVVTDFDLGSVVIDGQVKEDLRLISGDQNFDSLNESNPACGAERALALRAKKNSTEGLTEDEKEEFKALLDVCRKAIWVKKSYDLSAFRGKSVAVEVRLVTDAGYTEFGILLDNIVIGDKKLHDFEAADTEKGQWTLLGHAGQEEKTYHQLYLFEYRDPYEAFAGRNGSQSLNYDSGLGSFGNQSYFLNGGANQKEDFRALDMGYQPGVLVWYYNSRYSRRDNGSSIQDGKGYLLVLNARPKELVLPGPFSEAALLDENGAYRPDAEPLKSMIAKQKLDFACFSHLGYATYLEGVAPNCAQPDAVDAMQTVKKDGRPLRFRREWFNNILPWERGQFEAIGEPFRNDETIRTALATFRPEGSPAFSPFKVWRIDGSQLVPSPEETAAIAKFAPVSKFNDADNAFSNDPRFQGDNVAVEKKGFTFKVVAPNAKIVKAYDEQSDASSNNSAARKPRAKLMIEWKK